MGSNKSDITLTNRLQVCGTLCDLDREQMMYTWVHQTSATATSAWRSIHQLVAPTMWMLVLTVKCLPSRVQIPSIWHVGLVSFGQQWPELYLVIVAKLNDKSGKFTCKDIIWLMVNRLLIELFDCRITPQPTVSRICLSCSGCCYVIIVNDRDTYDLFVHCRLKLNSTVVSSPPSPVTTLECTRVAARVGGIVWPAIVAVPHLHGRYRVMQMHGTDSTLGQLVEWCTFQPQCCEFSFNIQMRYLMYVTAWLNWCRRCDAAIFSATTRRSRFVGASIRTSRHGGQL